MDARLKEKRDKKPRLYASMEAPREVNHDLDKTLLISPFDKLVN